MELQLTRLTRHWKTELRRLIQDLNQNSELLLTNSIEVSTSPKLVHDSGWLTPNGIRGRHRIAIHVLIKRHTSHPAPTVRPITIDPRTREHQAFLTRTIRNLEGFTHELSGQRQDRWVLSEEAHMRTRSGFDITYLFEYSGLEHGNLGSHCRGPPYLACRDIIT
jgi:hypothetical protein